VLCFLARTEGIRARALRTVFPELQVPHDPGQGAVGDGMAPFFEALTVLPLARVKASRTADERSSYRDRLCGTCHVPRITRLTAFREILRISLICRMGTPRP